jgi:hypothetical protein
MNCPKKTKLKFAQPINGSLERLNDKHMKFDIDSDMHGISHVGSVHQQIKILLAEHFPTRQTEPTRAAVIASYSPIYGRLINKTDKIG